MGRRGTDWIAGMIFFWMRLGQNPYPPLYPSLRVAFLASLWFLSPLLMSSKPETAAWFNSSITFFFSSCYLLFSSKCSIIQGVGLKALITSAKFYMTWKVISQISGVVKWTSVKFTVQQITFKLQNWSHGKVFTLTVHSVTKYMALITLTVSIVYKEGPLVSSLKASFHWISDASSPCTAFLTTSFSARTYSVLSYFFNSVFIPKHSFFCFPAPMLINKKESQLLFIHLQVYFPKVYCFSNQITLSWKVLTLAYFWPFSSLVFSSLGSVIQLHIYRYQDFAIPQLNPLHHWIHLAKAQIWSWHFPVWKKGTHFKKKKSFHRIQLELGFSLWISFVTQLSKHSMFFFKIYFPNSVVAIHKSI